MITVEFEDIIICDGILCKHGILSAGKHGGFVRHSDYKATQGPVLIFTANRIFELRQYPYMLPIEIKSHSWIIRLFTVI